MYKTGATVMVARREPHRAFAPAILAVVLGAVIATVWGVTASRNIRSLVREVPVHFVPAMEILTQAKADTQAKALPLHELVGAVSADLKARDEARSALADTIKSHLSEQP